jgi:hypothetical protein
MVMIMNRDLAINILKAVACCSTHDLSCYECPLFDKETHKCRPWHDSEVVEAVHTLNEERKDDG